MSETQAALAKKAARKAEMDAEPLRESTRADIEYVKESLWPSVQNRGDLAERAQEASSALVANSLSSPRRLGRVWLDGVSALTSADDKRQALQGFMRGAMPQWSERGSLGLVYFLIESAIEAATEAGFSESLARQWALSEAADRALSGTAFLHNAIHDPSWREAFAAVAAELRERGSSWGELAIQSVEPGRDAGMFYSDMRVHELIAHAGEALLTIAQDEALCDPSEAQRCERALLDLRERMSGWRENERWEKSSTQALCLFQKAQLESEAGTAIDRGPKPRL